MKEKNDSTFAFLVHPRDIRDLRRKYPALHLVPSTFLCGLTKMLPPVQVTTLTGLKNKEGEKVTGHVIAIMLTAEQMLENRSLAKKHVIKALHKAKKLGAKHVGLGAFTSVVTDGGLEVANVFSDVHVTNGNALTAHMSLEGLRVRVDQHHLKEPIISIVGATGSIGSVLTELVAKYIPFSQLYVIGRTPSHIQDLMSRVVNFMHGSKIKNTTIENAIPKSDVIIMTTSARSAVLDTRLLKKNAILYDITQPKNIPADITKTRPDVTIYEGGLSQLPQKLKYKFDLGTRKDQVYSCLGETMLLSLEGYPENFCLGKVTVDHVEYIKTLAEKYNFTCADIN